MKCLTATGRRSTSLRRSSNLGSFIGVISKRCLTGWIRLPIAYETDDFIIIHAGVEDIPDWKETSREFALYAPSFYEKGHQADKTVIVGHWPVVNYRANTVSSNCPLIDLEKKIIAIDGGNQIKEDGQLNALVIEGEDITYTYVDGLNEKTISRSHVDETGPSRNGHLSKL